MTPERLVDMRNHFANGGKLSLAEIGDLFLHVDALETALQPFAWCVIGEHRDDNDNVWHSLKVWHFREARKAMKGSGNADA